MAYVVYDTLLGKDAAASCRKIRVDKHASLDDAKRSAQMRFIRLARAPQPGGNSNLEQVTVEAIGGQIVFELPTPPLS